MTTFDQHANLAIAYVSVGSAVVGSTTGVTLVAESDGVAAEFPAAPFNVTVWQDDEAVLPSAEIMRVTGFDGHRTFTVERAQEGTPALAGIAVGWRFSNTITVKALTDIEVALNAIDAALSAHEVDTTNVHGIADTSTLETQAGAQSKADAAQAAAEAYADAKQTFSSVGGFTFSADGDIVFETASERFRIGSGTGDVSFKNVTAFDFGGGAPSPKFHMDAGNDLVTIDEYANVFFGLNALIEDPLPSSYGRTIPDFWWSAKQMRLGVRSMLVGELDEPPDVTFQRFGPAGGYPYGKGPTGGIGSYEDLTGLDASTCFGQVAGRGGIVPYNGGVWLIDTPGASIRNDSVQLNMYTSEMQRDLTGLLDTTPSARPLDVAIGSALRLRLVPNGGPQTFDVIQWNDDGSISHGRAAIAEGSKTGFLYLRGDSGINEIQTIMISGSPTSGAIKLTDYGDALVPPGSQTANIAWNASAADVKAALEAIPSIGAGAITATGGPFPDSAITVEFSGATVSRRGRTRMGVASTLTGGSPVVTVAHTQYGKKDDLAKDMFHVRHGGQSGDAPTGDYVRLTDPSGTDFFRIKGDRSVYAPTLVSSLLRAQIELAGLGIIAETSGRAVTNGTSIMVSQSVYLIAVPLLAGDVISTVDLCLNIAGSGLTTTKVALFDKTATSRLAVSADFSALCTSGAPKMVSANFLAPYTVPTSDVYYLGLYCNGVTPPTFVRGSNQALVGLRTGTGIRKGVVQASVGTDMPTSVTLADGAAVPAFYMAVR